MSAHPIFAGILAAASGDTVAAARMVQIEQVCSYCNGSGLDDLERDHQMISVRCPICHGLGSVKVTRKERATDGKDRVE